MEENEFVFDIICVSKTWCPNTELQNNSNLSLTWFDSVPYERSKQSREGGVLIFNKNNLSYKIRKALFESDEYKEILFLEVSYKNSSNILLSCCYKSPKGDNDIYSMFLKQVFKKPTAEKKPYYLVEDLSNILKMRKFQLFIMWCIALINKPIRVAIKSATIIDNVITANILNESLQNA